MFYCMLYICLFVEVHPFIIICFICEDFVFYAVCGGSIGVFSYLHCM